MSYADDFDRETYEDALHWSNARFDAEMKSIIDFLTEHSRVLDAAQIIALCREKRAINKARYSPERRTS